MLCSGAPQAEIKVLARAMILIWGLGFSSKLTGFSRICGYMTVVPHFLASWWLRPFSASSNHSSLPCGSHGLFAEWLCALFQTSRRIPAEVLNLFDFCLWSLDPLLKGFSQLSNAHQRDWIGYVYKDRNLESHLRTFLPEVLVLIF